MANSKFRNALNHSLKTDEERAVIREFYDMSYAGFLDYYGEGLGELTTASEAGKTRLKGRPYQLDNIKHRKARIDSNTEVKGFITPLPAGSGKTEIFLQSLFRTAKEVTLGDEVKLITAPTVIVVPSKDLADQVHHEVTLKFPNLLVGRRDGDNSDIQPLTIYVINSFMLDMQSNFFHWKDLRLGIVDEAHRILSVDRAREFRRGLGITLFDLYSASPVFTNRRKDDPNRGLYDLLGEESIIPSPTNRQLTDDEFLAPCHNVIQKIVLRREDIPEEIRSNTERFHDFLTRLKVSSAIEFYKTYEDPETGQKARGKPGIGFHRLVRDALTASEMFQEALAELAENDREMGRVLAPYSDYAVVVSRSLGNKAVEEALDKVLPLHKIPAERRKNPQPRALLAQTASMLREGFDAPDIKFVHGDACPNVLEIQTKGRARREVKAPNPKTRRLERQLSIVLDQLVELDGKLLGNPCLYHVAIDDPSVARGVMVVTPGAEVIEPLARETLEYKNQEEMKALVLGHGSAVQEKGNDFDKLWRKVQKHIYIESKKALPQAYILDGDPIRHKIVAVNGEDKEGTKQKTEVRISRSAIDQFRAALGIPGQINGLWLTEEAFEEAVIGTGPAAERYGPAYRKEIAAALRHFESGSKEPYRLSGKQVIIQTRLNDDGDLITAFHSSSVPIYAAKLDVLPSKTKRYLDVEEFTDAALKDVGNPKQYRKELFKLLKEAEDYYRKHHKPGKKAHFQVGGTRVEVSNCIEEHVGVLFCLARNGVRPFRRQLGITDPAFDIDGIEWSVEQGEIVKITRELEGRTDNRLSAEQFAALTGRSYDIELRFLKSLLERFDADKNLQTIIEFKVPIPRSAIYEVIGKGTGGKNIIIDNSEGVADELAAAIKKAKENRLTTPQFAELTERSKEVERRFLKSLLERFDADKNLQTITEFKVPIPRGAIYEVTRSGGGGKIIVIDNSEGVADVLAEAIKKAKENCLTAQQFAELTERSAETENRFSKSLLERFDADKNLQTITEFGVPIPRTAIYEVPGVSPTGKIILIDNSEGVADELAAAIKKAKENRLTAPQFAELTERSRQTERVFLQSLLERFDADKNLQTITEFGVPIPRAAIYEVSGRSTTGKITIIDNSEGVADALANAIKARESGKTGAKDEAGDDEDPRAHLKKPRPGKPSLDPGSKHIQDRSGRTRSQAGH